MYTRYTECLRGYEIYRLVDHTMDNITIYEVFLIHVPKKRGEEIMYFHGMVMPQHKKSCPGVNEINNYGRPILGYHYYRLSLPKGCPGVEKFFLK